MEAESEEMTVQQGKLRELSSGLWYVHCKWCDTDTTRQARNEEEAYGMLDEWRLSMPKMPSKYRAQYFKETKETTTSTCESAGQLAHAAATLFDGLKAEVQQLEAEVVGLKAEVHGHVAYQAAHT